MNEQTAPTRGRVVVGVDGSVQSTRVLTWAARIAETIDADIDVVIVWHFPANFGWTYVPEDWNLEEDARKTIDAAVAKAFPRGTPPHLRTVVRQGFPAQVLLEQAEGAEMLVVGSRGHGGFAGLMLGSVSANCAEHARCPVLVVHGGEPGGDRR